MIGEKQGDVKLRTSIGDSQQAPCPRIFGVQLVLERSTVSRAVHFPTRYKEGRFTQKISRLSLELA
jgi:hypothetical protein